MSNTQHLDATLPGYMGPFFPDSILELGKQFGRPSAAMRGTILRMVARRLGGDTSRDHSVTSDDYSWFWGVEFNNAAIVILIPWAQDWDMYDGTQTDRSCALYVRSAREDLGEGIIKIKRLTELLKQQTDQLTADERARSNAPLN